jgi:hypothetical protein
MLQNNLVIMVQFSWVLFSSLKTTPVGCWETNGSGRSGKEMGQRGKENGKKRKERSGPVRDAGLHAWEKNGEGKRKTAEPAWDSARGRFEILKILFYFIYFSNSRFESNLNRIQIWMKIYSNSKTKALSQFKIKCRRHQMQQPIIYFIN